MERNIDTHVNPKGFAQHIDLPVQDMSLLPQSGGPGTNLVFALSILNENAMQRRAQTRHVFFAVGAGHNATMGHLSHPLVLDGRWRSRLC